MAWLAAVKTAEHHGYGTYSLAKTKFKTNQQNKTYKQKAPACAWAMWEKEVFSVYFC